MIELSRNAERALDAVAPRLRGASHVLAAVVAAPLAVRATMLAEPGRPRVAVGLYTGAVVVMLALSAGMHLRRRGPLATEVWIRLDHTGIYGLIGAGSVAVAMLGLPPTWRRWVIPVAVVLALVGLVVEWWPRATPRGFAHGMFLGAGWVMVPTIVALGRGPGGAAAVWWLLAGGLAYTVGAVIVARRRPDPWPRWFGYHELWHLLVLVAVACHWHLVVRILAGGP